MHFADRAAAGRALAAALAEYRDRSDVLVLGLPRGGVPVAYEVAQALRAPLDVIIVRKLGAPGQPELAVGAIASGGVTVLNDSVMRWFRDVPDLIEAEAARERPELERREVLYRAGRPALDLRNQTLILVDDGAATGASMQSAVEAARKLGALKIVVALPVAAVDACERLRKYADDMICLSTPHSFMAVGQWYDDFSQTSDQEVRDLLARAAR